jgi:hypothetical protein
MFTHSIPMGHVRGSRTRTTLIADGPQSQGPSISGNRAEKLRPKADFVDSPSEGDMTGLAIVALRQAGVQPSDRGIQRGIYWLFNNQRD